MKKYEGLFIFPPEASGESPKDPTTEVTKWIEKFQGKVLQKTDLGKKTIGHPIKKHKEGKFIVVNFEMDPARAQEFRKELELQETLLKYMITVSDGKAKLPVAPVASPAPVTNQA